MKKGFILFLVVLTLLGGAASAAESEDGKFNAGEMIMHHIADAHEIHLIGDLAIYLPVIVKTDNGWDVFSSSHLYHNPQTTVAPNGEKVKYYQYGDYIMYHEQLYMLEDGIKLNEEGEVINQAVALDLSITKTVAGMFLVVFIMLLLFISVAKSYKKRGVAAPKGLQSFMEPLILFIRDEVARPSIGKKADRFV